MAGNGSRQTKDRAWIEREINASEFRDDRLRKRFGVLLEQLWDSMGQSIPFACQDWASTKAAYRFLSNERVNERDILSGHFAATADRFKVSGGTTLVLRDTTIFSYKRERPELVGYTGKATMRTGYKGNGLQNSLTQCGILMHSSLAVTIEGLPLGLTAIKFWIRSKFKGCTALKRHVNATRVPIEQKES
ncbi:IS4/Tn5 family transposase DNA-binding protein [Paraburkholderia sp. MM5477-R1]|uniref:IS4/Tn5 family transposase DNA-binding protein n=1 Tax=Paraburkholderia sp. MM5477-R1 TaxID=2991062 RepID=UPI003D1E5125